METQKVWDWVVPDIYEINRALDFIGWVREGGADFAAAQYAKKHGNQPCFAKDNPDLGLLFAVRALWRLQTKSRPLSISSIQTGLDQ